MHFSINYVVASSGPKKLRNLAFLQSYDNLSLIQEEDDVCWLLLGKVRIQDNAKTVTGSDSLNSFHFSQVFKI